VSSLPQLSIMGEASEEELKNRVKSSAILETQQPNGGKAGEGPMAPKECPKLLTYFSNCVRFCAKLRKVEGEA